MMIHLGFSYPTLPSYPVTGHPLPFTEYNLSFPGASSEYYGHTVPQVASSNVDGNAEGSLIDQVTCSAAAALES